MVTTVEDDRTCPEGDPERRREKKIRITNTIYLMTVMTKSSQSSGDWHGRRESGEGTLRLRQPGFEDSVG